VWVNGAANLAYGSRSGMRGKPSACAKVKVGHGEAKYTSTIPADANPRWNTPVIRFEVERSDRLRLDVLDLASSGGEAHLHQHFLGQVEVDLAEILDRARDLGMAEPVPFRCELQGTGQRAEIEFECLYEPYDDTQDGQLATTPKPRRQQTLPLSGGGPSRQQTLPLSGGGPSRQQTLPPPAGGPSQSRPPRDSQRHRTREDSFDQDVGGIVSHRTEHLGSRQSFRSTVTSDMGQLGVLSVRIIAAANLQNLDTGILGDVSDPFVALHLESQGESQRKRTHTINNDLNPHWNSSPFLFPLQREDDKLIFEVYNENMLQANQCLGRLVVPLIQIVRSDGVVRIKDELQDAHQGELEVEIGFSAD